MSEIVTRLPQYQHLYEILRQQLTKGIFKIGTLLPSEKELQQTYGMTQPTVRQALSMLAEEGYIKKYQGKGSVVQPAPIGLGMLQIYAHDEHIALDPEVIRTDILQRSIVPVFPDGFSFTPPSARMEMPYYVFERIRLVENEVIFYERMALSNHEIPDFHKQKLENRSLFNLLRSRYNIIVKGGEEKVWATSATPEISAMLRLAPHTPVLRLEKRIDTNRPNLSLYSSLYASTDNYLLKGRF
jgi:GntR family transcriptional regulator, frlABCD operon transcriptional regulator